MSGYIHLNYKIYIYIYDALVVFSLKQQKHYKNIISYDWARDAGSGWLVVLSGVSQKANFRSLEDEI